MSDPEAALGRLREQIQEVAVLNEADREALLAFGDQLNLLRAGYSAQRHEKRLRHCAIMAGLARQGGEDIKRPAGEDRSDGEEEFRERYPPGPFSDPGADDGEDDDHQ